MRTAELRSHIHPTEPRLKIVPRSIQSPVRFRNVRAETESGESTTTTLSVVPILGERPPIGTMLAELHVLAAEICKPQRKHLIDLDPQVLLTIQSPFLLEKSPPTHLLVATEIMAINQAPPSSQIHLTQLERIKLQPNSAFRVALTIDPHHSLLPFQVRLTISNPLRYRDQPVCQTFTVTTG